MLVYTTTGDHVGGESEANVEKNKKGLSRQMAETNIPTGQTCSRLIDAGNVAPHYVPMGPRGHAVQ